MKTNVADRELLELASKASAIALEWDGPPDEWQPLYYEGKTYHYWNPLTNDGDALRLAVLMKREEFRLLWNEFTMKENNA